MRFRRNSMGWSRRRIRAAVSVVAAVIVPAVVYLAGPDPADMAIAGVLAIAGSAVLGPAAALLAGYGALVAFFAHGQTLEGREGLVFSLVVLGASSVGAATHAAAVRVIRDVRRGLRRDAATGYPDVTELEQRLDEHATSEIATIAVLVAEFPEIDTAGPSLDRREHDAFLAELAARLANTGGDGGVYRYPGGGLARVVHGAVCQETVKRALEWPWTLPSGRQAIARAEIGVARYPDDTAVPRDLPRAARAVALASGRGKGGHARGGLSPIHLAGELARALTAGEIVPVHQRRVDARTCLTSGAEILLRWPGGPGPGEFVATAEQFDMTGELLEVALDGAAAASTVLAGRISVNLSGADLAKTDVAERILSGINARRLDADRLEVEVTETALAGLTDGEILPSLERLRSAGVTVALDDFGTGQSSLRQLLRWQIDTVKIDREFVRGVPEDPNAVAVVDAVVAVTRVLGARTVAEGVETQRQAAALLDAGVNELQGYLHHRPEPIPGPAPDGPESDQSAAETARARSAVAVT